VLTAKFGLAGFSVFSLLLQDTCANSSRAFDLSPGAMIYAILASAWSPRPWVPGRSTVPLGPSAPRSTSTRSGPRGGLRRLRKGLWASRCDLRAAAFRDSCAVLAISTSLQSLHISFSSCCWKGLAACKQLASDTGCSLLRLETRYRVRPTVLKRSPAMETTMQYGWTCWLCRS